MLRHSATEKAVLAILERLPISVVISDPRTGQILWVNARDMRLVTATDPRQIVGRNLLDFLVPEQHELALQQIEAVGRGGTSEPTVYQLRRFDGGTTHVQISSVPVIYRGQPAMLSLVADVTEREVALRELAESEERYRALVEYSPYGIVVCVDGTIAYANPTLLAKLGASEPGDVIGHMAFDFIDPSFHDVVRQARRTLMATGKPLPPARIVMKRIDGTPFPAIAQPAPVHWQGEAATQTVVRESSGTGD